MNDFSRLFLVCWLSTALLLGGCGRGKPPAKYRIVVIPKGATHDFWKSVHAGAKKAAEEYNKNAPDDKQVEIVWQAPKREDARQEQQDIVQRFTFKKASAIVLAPTDQETLVLPVKDALNKDIPVVIMDSGLAESDDILKHKRYLGYVATDNEMGGRKAAQRLGELLAEKEKAVVLMMPYQEGSQSTELREKGFKEEIAKYPNIELKISAEEAGATVDTALKASERQLSKHTELDGIFTPNESSTVGMLQALRNLKRVGDVKFVGFDSSKTLIDAMKANELHGLVLQDPFDMGYQSTKRAIDALKGHPPGEPVHHTNLGVATPDNLDSDEIQRMVNPPTVD